MRAHFILRFPQSCVYNSAFEDGIVESIIFVHNDAEYKGKSINKMIEDEGIIYVSIGACSGGSLTTEARVKLEGPLLG